MRKVVIITLFCLSLLTISAVFYYPAEKVLAAPEKQYRFGQSIDINNKNYLIASDKELAEILEIMADNKLTQASEIHGAEKIEALVAGQYLNKYYLIIATGRYLYRYNISDPAAPKIEFRRDLYVFKRGQFKIGSVYCLAANNDFLYGGGANGTRSFNLDNLFVNKIYTHEKTYGLAADDKNLYVITENKGLVFNLASGDKVEEIDLENKDKTTRAPYFDDLGNAYFPSDRGLIRLNIFSGEKKLYSNPVPLEDVNSYGVFVLPSGEDAYYANGHGIAMLNKNFIKTKFFNTSWQERYGANSWAVGVTAAKIGARELIIAFNKSSILLFDKNLKVLVQYKYKRAYPDYITTDLKILLSVNVAAAGEKITLRLFGFWPNENIIINFGKNNYTVKVDNQGYALTDLAVPFAGSRVVIIQATGQDSTFNYQSVFRVL